MKCYACYADIKEEKSTCDICGMTNPKIIGDNAQAVELLEKLGNEYRQEKLNGVNISVTAYEYEEKDGTLSIKVSHKVNLTNAGNLVYGKTMWFEQKFAKIPTEREADLEVVLDGKVSKAVTVNFHTPKLDDYWQVGLELKEGFQVIVKIGNEQDYAETKSFSII